MKLKEDIFGRKGQLIDVEILLIKVEKNMWKKQAVENLVMH